MCYAQCCHGDGSGVRHVHHATIRLQCLRLFNTMATVVMGDTCVRSITGICTTICDYCLRLSAVVILAMGGMWWSCEQTKAP